MNRILKIGMDVHSTNYTLCAMEPTIGSEDRIYGEIQVAPDYKEIVAFIASLKLNWVFIMIILLNAVTRQAAWDIPYTISLRMQESSVSFLHQRPCLLNRESESKRTSAMLV